MAQVTTRLATAADLGAVVACVKNLAMYRRRGWIEVERRTEHGYDRVYMERWLGADEGWQ
ncbi:MAG TPA: hypothetical protein VHW23_36575 [Kofleriaceae bacterium]|jgi:hypothetical protein|nr:hypothetical protein [Kofleriaceae bacterium]